MTPMHNNDCDMNSIHPSVVLPTYPSQFKTNIIFTRRDCKMSFRLRWENYTETATEAWLDIGLQSLLCILVVVLIFVYLFCVVCNKTAMKEILGILNKLMLLGLFVVFIEIYLNYYVTCVSRYVLNYQYKHQCFYRVLLQIPWIMERLICYTFFLIRLRLAFDESKYSISRQKTTILFILCDLSYIGIFTIIAIQYYYNTGYSCKTYSFGAVLLGLLSLNDIIWNIVFCYMFISRLKHMYVVKKSWQIIELMNRLTLLS